MMIYPLPLLLVNGIIHTFDEGQPPADAMAIDRSNGRILSVGKEADVRADIGIFAAVETVDLRGRVVIPGLIDAHTHLLGSAHAEAEVDLDGCADETAAAARVAARAATTPPGTWIHGRRWNQQFWPGRAFPSKASLDAAAPDHPVALWSHSTHVMWVNSLALARAGIDDQTPDPPGGTIGHDDSGALDGMLYEMGAIAPIEDAYEDQSDSDEQELEAYARVMRNLISRGLTTVHTIEGARALHIGQRLHDDGALSMRLRYYLRVEQLDAIRTIGLEGGFGDDWLRVAGIKIFADGALGTHTSAMLDPFDDDPLNHGMITTPADLMEAQVRGAARGGLGVAIHAIGDRAVRVALDGIERAITLAEPGIRSRRFRIEHVQLAAPEDLARMARLGVIGSVQPFHAVSDRDVADRSWGARAARGYAYGTMAKMGIRLALGSDTPVETADPWRIMHAAIARTDDRSGRPAWHPAQALSPAQALWGYTVGAAWAGNEETQLGRLAPGMLADFVVLGDDPLLIAPGELPHLPIEATFIGGQVAAGAL